MIRRLLAIIAASVFFTSCGGNTERELIVGCYNLRQDNPSDTESGNGWQTRRDAVAALIAWNDFDLFGAQEPFHHQVEELVGLLPQYDYVGVGRDDGVMKGEYSPVFYKKDKFEVLESGTFWLSETPDVPDKGWGASYPRICTWALLRDREDGFRFRVFNHHADYQSPEAQIEGTRLILKRIGEIEGNEPVILMGDFNADEYSPSYDTVQKSGMLADCYDRAAIRHAPTGTENHFQSSTHTTRRIDHIFVTPQWDVSRYSILANVYAAPESGDGSDSEIHYVFRFPSDHHAVRTVLKYRI